MREGKFIAFEGVDGSGKSTHARLLAEYLQTKGHEVVLTAEPTKGFVGQIIRMVLSSKLEVSPRTLALLFTADRAEHIDKIIEPSLKEGKVVITERYYYSTLAYQSSQGLNFNWLVDINKFAIEPDMVIMLEIDPDDALARINRDKEIFEVREFQHEVQKELIEYAYTRYKILKSKAKTPWRVVMANDDIDSVQEKIRVAVETKLKL